MYCYDQHYSLTPENVAMSLQNLKTHWEHENCPLYEVAGCPLFRGCLSIEVNGRAIGTFRIVRYIVGVRYSGVSVKRASTAYHYKT